MTNFKTKRNTQVIVAIWINVKMSQMRLEGSFLKWMPFHMSFPLKSDSYKIKKKRELWSSRIWIIVKEQISLNNNFAISDKLFFYNTKLIFVLIYNRFCFPSQASLIFYKFIFHCFIIFHIYNTILSREVRQPMRFQGQNPGRFSNLEESNSSRLEKCPGFCIDLILS